VFYEKGFLNWHKPMHGQYGRLSSGMYGMLPVFIESLGASSLISADLSEQDLQDADALVLLFPDEPWAEDQLERIWDFVHQGGSLLVMGEHTTRDENGSNRFNEVLEPTSIQVEFDSGTFAIGGWLQSYEAIAHPATTGVPDDRNQFGVVIGASLETSRPARPLLIGRWGWSDMGDEGSDRAMMGNGHYDSGEKLGDLILAAEQPLGKGRVIAFGDTSGLTNGINVSSHVFTSRLFGYLAGGRRNAHPIWRPLLGILGCGLLIGLVARHTGEGRIILVTLCLAGSLAVCTSISRSAGEILPTSMDGDGTLSGYDIPFTKSIADAVNIPIIASGGAGQLEHLYEGVVKGGATTLLAASIFHFRKYSIKEVKEYLKTKGIEVKL